MKFPGSIVFILTLIIFSLSCEKEPCDCKYCTDCDFNPEMNDVVLVSEKEGWIVFNKDSATYMIGVPYYNDPVFYIPCRFPEYLNPVNMRPVTFSGTFTDAPLIKGGSIKTKYYCIRLDTIYYSDQRIDTLTEYKSPDPKYPTTYNKLSDESFTELKAQFGKNKYCGFKSTIDIFGFCKFSGSQSRTCPDVYASFTKEQAESFTWSFILDNLPYIGIKDTSEISGMDFISWGTPGVSNSRWRTRIGHQFVKGLEVESTEINFWMDAGGVQRASGHWYPEIYIPEKEEISFIEAQCLMTGKKFKWMCWVMVEESITENTIWDTQMRKSIVPVIKDDRIELRVVWILKTDHHFNIEVDTMTGEVIRYYPDIIC